MFFVCLKISPLSSISVYDSTQILQSISCHIYIKKEVRKKNPAKFTGGCRGLVKI